MWSIGVELRLLAQGPGSPLTTAGILHSSCDFFVEWTSQPSPRIFFRIKWCSDDRGTFAPTVHLAASGDTFDGHNWGWRGTSAI